MPAFEVVSEYTPSGDQPQAIAKLAQGIEDGLREQILLGVTGSGKTYTMAKVIEAVQRPALVLAHNKTLAAQLCEEFKEFFPNNAVEYFVSYYDYYQPEAYIPHTDTFIEKDASINEEVEKLRHAATSALLSRRDVIVVASVSCIYGIGSPMDYAGMAVFVDKEKEMVMMYLSAHPLDPYYMEITYGCNTTCEDFKDAERAGNKVTMAGLVTKVSTKMSRKGTEFSIIELEDFSGKAEIRLFGRNHQTLREKFREGEPVYLKISYMESRFNPDRIDVSFDEIHPLEDMKGKIANAIMLFIDMQYKDKDFFQSITGIKDKSRPGDLYIDLVDSGKKCNVRVHARKKIPLNKELVDLLENNGIRFKMATI